MGPKSSRQNTSHLASMASKSDKSDGLSNGSEAPVQHNDFLYVKVEGSKAVFASFVLAVLASIILFLYLMATGIGEYVGQTSTSVERELNLRKLTSPNMLFFSLIDTQ